MIFSRCQYRRLSVFFLSIRICRPIWKDASYSVVMQNSKQLCLQVIKSPNYVLSTCTLSSHPVREISGLEISPTFGSISSASIAMVARLSALQIPDAWQRTSHFLWHTMPQSRHCIASFNQICAENNPNNL